MPITLYIAGPMRGHADCNFPAFDTAAQHLRSAGYRVVNPAEIDRACAHMQGDHVDVARYLLRDLSEVAHCQGISLLDGWGSSQGVAVEMAFAAALNIPCRSVADWCNNPDA